ncbi:MAG: hypothetical protein L0H15_09675 [Nitrosospira sp.]|nr:hypothetical protein [Nitrosospira sp.]
MARMSIRATYALDEQTDQRIKYLAETWRVSQAEVIRRSVREAAEHADNALTPADVVAHYRSTPLLRSSQETRRRMEAAREWRHEDDELRSSR